ncbi:MAG: hypothetical protein IT220_09280 [Flavobacteriaceae bacterium]|nr:hypothetical protein [Flavobacteriaceae bacterium]
MNKNSNTNAFWKKTFLGLAFISLAIVLFSCKNEKKIEVFSIPIGDTLATNSPYAFREFKWNAALQLKMELLTDLQLQKDSNDVLITKFIDKYSKLSEDFNDKLYGLPYYDSINTFYYDPEEVLPMAKAFEKKVNESGFELRASEGMAYIGESGAFISQNVMPFLDPLSASFLKIYARQLDFTCCEDAGIVITDQELVQRVYVWGKLMDQVGESKYKNIVENSYYGNLDLLFTGLDNTPAFDFDNEKFRQELIDEMQIMIDKYPQSRAAIEFQKYLEILKTENYLYTEKVQTYLKENIQQEP